MDRSSYLIGCSFNQSRRASLSRVCQPFPLALNASRTSSERRMLTAFFGDTDFGLPRLGSTESSSFGNTSLAGLNVPKSALVSSRTSPSLSVKGKCFAMSFSLPLICLAKADNSDSSGNRSGTNYMQPVLQIPYANKSPFRVQLPIIFRKHCSLPIEISSPIKRQTSLLSVFIGFGRVKFNFHKFIVYTKNNIVKNSKVAAVSRSKAWLRS